jgi:hypothetical protein
MEIQQNSFNLKSDNSEILIIWHVRRLAPRPPGKKNFSSETGKSEGHVEKDCQE